MKTVNQVLGRPDGLRLNGLSLVTVTFLLVAYVNLASLVEPWVALPTLLDLTIALTLTTMLFSLLHAAALFGWRSALLFFGLSAVVSWLFEEIGVRTGLVYGAYHYTDLLGPKLGHVPLLIPLAWFMMIYPSYLIANLLVDGDIRPRHATILHILGRALVAGLVMTAWDLVIDPGMSAPGGAWVWEQGGAYFGVPIQNFFGWLLTTVTVYACYGLSQRRMRLSGVSAVPAWFGLLPPVVYAMMTLRYIVENEGGVFGIVALFAMGLPCLLAFWRAGERGRVCPNVSRVTTAA